MPQDMHRKLKRAINRQTAIRESRDLAWILLVVVLGVAYVGVVGFVRAVEVTGTVATAGAIVSGLVALVAVRVAFHLALEALRLGRLMRDSEQIMQLEDSSELVTGVRWSRLNPFRWRRS